MNLWNVYRTSGPIDLKSIRRDDLLAWVMVVPLIVALALRFGTPLLAEWLHEGWAFDLQPYYDLLMSFFVLMAPSMIGMAVGFLLLDERDDRTLTALAVTPMPLSSYLFYRITLPLVLGFVITVVGYPLAGLSPLPVGPLVLIALVASLNAPVTTLFLAGFAENKVSGFAFVKVLNTINLLPVAAYFVEMPWQATAGIIPAYWPMKMLWQASAGASYLIYGCAGLVVNTVVVAFLYRRFITRMRT